MIVKEFNFPPYKEMVKNLFKKDLPGNHAGLLHAALGIAGEAGELKTALSRKNFLEETGDIEFYIQAALNYLEEIGKPYEEPFAIQSHSFTLGNFAEIIHQCGSEIIDFTKKAFVYGNREPNFTGVNVVLRDLRQALDFGYELSGTTREEVLYLNQVKLIGKDGRYKSGQYSDAAAIAREDKVASGEEPSKA